MRLLISYLIWPTCTGALWQHTYSLWHRRCLQVSARESVCSFSAQHHTLCREQIRALTWGMCLGVCILFFRPERASGQIGAWIRGGTLSVSLRIALSAAFSGSENQTTKLASDREISQSEEAFFPLAVHLPGEKVMSSRKPWPCFPCSFKWDLTEIL